MRERDEGMRIRNPFTAFLIHSSAAYKYLVKANLHVEDSVQLNGVQLPN